MLELNVYARAGMVALHDSALALLFVRIHTNEALKQKHPSDTICPFSNVHEARLRASTNDKVTHILSDFPDERVEGVVDAHSRLGRRLDEADAVALGDLPRLRRVHVADGQVALVAH